MDYILLSLPEATGLYLGLALQAMIRMSSLGRWLPYLLITVGGLSIIVHEMRRAIPAPHAWLISLGVYLAISLILTALFWPEASIFGTVSRLTPTQVASYAAQQDPQARIVTASDTGEAPATRIILETPGFKLLLHAITETPLAFAKALNPDAHQPFRALQSMSWLLGITLTSDVQRALTDWVEGCWKPAMAQDVEFQDAVSAQQLLPWGDGPVATALATRETVPGASTGYGYFHTSSPLGTLFLNNPGSPRTVKCDVYLSAVQMEVERSLFTTKSPGGAPLSQIFQEDGHGEVAQQAQFLIYREALTALGRPSPAPSLVGAYATLSAAKAAGGALGGALGSGKPGGWLGGLLGGGGAVVNQFDGAVTTLLWAVSVAMWFVFWSPFIFGTALQVLVGLFPVVFCYALIPKAQFKPLVIYFLTLLYVCCSPLWFALVDLAARAAAARAPHAQDAVFSMLNWAPEQVYSVVVTVIGLVLVFSIGAGILFLSARGMIGAIRA